MSPSWILSLLFILTACGGAFTFVQKPEPVISRGIASINEADIDQKLFALHAYQIIARKETLKIDELKHELSKKDLHQSNPYYSFLAANAQVEEFENELLKYDRKILTQKVQEFSKKGPLERASLSGLMARMKMEQMTTSFPGKVLIEMHYRELRKSMEFQVLEKNIEHHSHLMKLNRVHKGKNVVSARTGLKASKF